MRHLNHEGRFTLAMKAFERDSCLAWIVNKFARV